MKRINRKYAILAQLVMIFAVSIYTNSAIAQPPPCDTCDYEHEIFRMPDIEAQPGLPDTTLNAPYQGCTGDTIRRGIGFIHGLGGSSAGWYLQRSYTDTGYATPSYTVDYTGYENNMLDVALQMNDNWQSSFDAGINQAHPNRCRLSDYAIAHSQGGFAARFLDRQWDVNTSGTYGTRKFYGLVTFGTPNGGAPVALTKDQHFDFVQSVVSTVILDKDGILLDLTNKFGFLFGNSVFELLNQLDSVNKRELAPLMLADVHANTVEEMRPDNQTFLDIDAHDSKLRRVVFYGIEDAPECWRLMDNIVTQAAEDYPIWGAQPDTAMMNKMERIRADHESSILENKKKIKAYGVLNALYAYNFPVLFSLSSVANVNLVKNKINYLNTENKHRQQNVDFLNNANTQWRYLIGSYHRDSFSTQTRTRYQVQWEEKYGFLSKWYNQTRVFSSTAEREAYITNVTNQVHSVRNIQNTTLTDTIKVKSFYPSDGLIPVKNQIAWPGTKQDHMDKMEHNHHFQERNSSETKRVLEKLYQGDYDEFFQITP